MERPSQEITTRVSGNRKLAYRADFRALLREAPIILSSSVDLAQRAEDNYDPPDTLWGGVLCRFNKKEKKWEEIEYFGKPIEPRPFSFQRGVVLSSGEPITDEETSLEVTVLGISNRDFVPSPSRHATATRIDRSTYFRVRAGDEQFFVKKSSATVNPGFSEFANTVTMENILSGIEEVKVVEAQLGYQDSTQSWYVSSWKDFDGFTSTTNLGNLNPISEYGEVVRDREFEVSKGHIEVKRVQNLIKAKALEAGITILDLSANLFYNPKTKKYVLLDVTTETQDRLNQPIQESNLPD